MKYLLDTNVYLDASRSAASREQFRTSFIPLVPRLVTPTFDDWVEASALVTAIERRDKRWRVKAAGAAFLTAWADKKRDEMLHQIQRILHDRVVFAPIWENGFIRGVGPKVEEPALTLIPAFPYSAPYEDVRLKRP